LEKPRFFEKGEQMKRIMVVGMLIAATVIASAALAAEEKWPTRPITIFVGFAPGGGMDMMGRLMSEEMKTPLGVAMPIVNMVGANGAIMMDHVYKQPRDGYALAGISTSQTTYPATGLSKLTYKEFGLIGIVFGTYPIFSVPWDSPIKTPQDLLEGLKKGGLTGGNIGLGSLWHMPQVILNNTIGGKFRPVVYEGGPAVALAIAKREVEFGTNDLSEALTFIKSKMVRPLFLFDDKPFDLEGYGVIPPITNFVPQMKDKISGGKGFRALGYVKGIPEDRIKKLIDTFKVAMASDAVKKFGKVNLLPLGEAVGAEADKIFVNQTQVQSWLLHDINAAKRNPEELGIPRPGK
jgi:tripartite-type tricarboxylate transporter receptor subunit TctC